MNWRAAVGLPFTSRSQVKTVDAFYRAALAAGGQDNGAPGLRPEHHSNYYGAFVLMARPDLHVRFRNYRNHDRTPTAHGTTLALFRLLSRLHADYRASYQLPRGVMWHRTAAEPSVTQTC
jgi:hypothetical protein